MTQSYQVLTNIYTTNLQQATYTNRNTVFIVQFYYYSVVLSSH